MNDTAQLSPQISPQNLARNSVPMWKRVLDVTLVLAAAPGWLLFGLLIAAAIKLVSRGPVFFKQERIGHLGKRFKCWKFRTMAVGANAGVHQDHLSRLMTSNSPMMKLDSAGDPRVIPGGLILRSLGLDELPQIINIFRGEMSLVGPRPCLPYEYDRYLPRHRQRFNTLPGLTGLWQISGKNRTTFEEMMDLDIRYAESKSLGMDLKIIATTVPAIIDQVNDLRRKQESVPQNLVLGGLNAIPPQDQQS